MRLFVAIEVPPALRRCLGESVERLRAGLPRARWARPENWHLTLAFLGETPKERLGELERALGPVFGSRRRFPLRLEGCGRFPTRGRARVVWIGFGKSEELLDLERGVRRALENELGLPAERRPFHPHLTVARCSPPWPARSAEAWIESRPTGLGESFAVDRGALIRSRLGAGGASYSVVQSYRMEDAECTGAV